MRGKIFRVELNTEEADALREALDDVLESGLAKDEEARTLRKLSRRLVLAMGICEVRDGT